MIDKLSNQENLKNILEKEFNSSSDVSKLELEISNYEKSLSDLNKKKNHIISQIDTLSSFDPSYEVKYDDLNHRLDKFYSDIGLLETMITKAREKLSINTAKNNNSEAVLSVFKGIGSIIKKVSRDEQSKIIHKVIDGILLKEEYKEGENPISKIFFKMPLFKNQASTNEIEFDSKNLPIIYKTLEVNDKVDVIVDIKDIIGKIKVPTITFEHYKAVTRNRAGKQHTYDEVVQYIQNKYNTYVTKNYITEVRNTVLGKEHHQYTPKGFKFDIIKEALEYFKFI